MAACRPSPACSSSSFTVPTFNVSSVMEEHGVAKRKLPKIFLTPTLQTRRHRPTRGAVKKLDAGGATPSPSASTAGHATPRRPKPFSLSPRPGRTLHSQDRLMPSRSLTDLTLASHLLSPLSLSPSCPTSDADGSDVDEVAGGGSGGGGVSDRCGRRIFQFGRPSSSSSSSSSSSLGDVEAPPGGRHLLHPLASLQTTPRVKIAAKPDRIMAAPGTFLQYGLQSANWAPSAMLVVALESGVYICKVHEDCHVIEFDSGSKDPDNPFYHVLWNEHGDAVLCAKLTGCVQLCDLKEGGTQWEMETGQLVRCVALERDRLLTCGTERHGVGVYDVRRAAAVDRPVWRLLTDRHRRVSVNSLSWSANGHTLACGTQSGLVHLWDVRQPAKEMQVHANQQGSPIQVLNWCPWKTSVLASGSGHPKPSICLQNTATATVQSHVECDAEVTGIQFNPHLRQMATSHNTNAHIYRLDTNAETQRLGADSSVELWRQQPRSARWLPLTTLSQHENGIVSMAVSSHHHQLLTMGGDELLCLWQWTDAGAAGRPPNAAAAAAQRRQPRSQLQLDTLLR